MSSYGVSPCTAILIIRCYRESARLVRGTTCRRSWLGRANQREGCVRSALGGKFVCTCHWCVFPADVLFSHSPIRTLPGAEDGRPQGHRHVLRDRLGGKRECALLISDAISTGNFPHLRRNVSLAISGGSTCAFGLMAPFFHIFPMFLYNVILWKYYSYY